MNAASTASDTNGAVFRDRVLMFSDIEDSSGRWDAEPDAMRVLMRHHDDVVDRAVLDNGGFVGARTGDGAIALFDSAVAAARAALDLQRRIADGPKETGLATAPLVVRIGLHRGVVEARGGEHYGPPMHRTARIMSAGRGRQTVVSDAIAAELVGADGHGSAFVLVDCGLHRLKGFQEPERLRLLVDPNAPTDDRGLRVASVSGSLPSVDLDDFVGRVSDLETVRAHLAPGAIVSLVGTGGVGKTRLALQIAHLAQGQFPDGVWFVDLAGASGEDRVLPMFANALEIGDESRDVLDVVRQGLHSRQMLVVVDNCEHVIGAVSSLLNTTCSPAMSACLLTTTQRALNVHGERAVTIAPLNAIGPDSPAAQLFLRAAQRADATFALDPNNRTAEAALSDICRRLEGLPLALELAAARVRVMSIRQIADELASRLDLLRSRDQPERHRTLDAAMAWSIALLSEQDRRTLTDVSIFETTFDWEAAAAVCDDDRFDVADSLDELVRRSLLVRSSNGLRMLMPLRMHCRAELRTSGRFGSVEERYARWVTSAFGSGVDDVDPSVAVARIDRVVDASEDIHAAHQWLAANDPAGAARLALSLGDAWIARARSKEAIPTMLSCDHDGTPIELRLELLGWIAAFAWTAGVHETGENAARRALALAEANGLPLPLFAAIRLAVRCAFSHRNDEARDLISAIEHEIGVGRGDRSRLLPVMGVVVAVLGDTKRGIELADAGVAQARNVGSLRLLSALTNRLLLEPTSDEVAALTGEVVDLARVLGRTSAQAHATAALAHQARRRGDVLGFLTGVWEFAELLLLDEPTSVVQMLQWVPAATESEFPRDTAVLLAALESLAEQHNFQGTDREALRRSEIRARLSDRLGEAISRKAWEEGSALELAEAVDRLRWMVDATAERLRAS